MSDADKQVEAWVAPIYSKSTIDKAAAFPIVKLYAEQRNEANAKAEHWKARAEKAEKRVSELELKIKELDAKN